MKSSLSHTLTLLLAVSACVMSLGFAGSARAAALVGEKSSPDACLGQSIQKCARWYSMNLKSSPDACAATKSTLGQCGLWYIASEAPAPVKAPKVIVLRGVNFETGSARIRSESIPVLDQNVDGLKENTRSHVEIEGHTDSRGSDASNQKLSEARANSVMDYFIEHGINSSRLSANGKGESSPIAGNDTDEGRFQNRRIELHLK